MKYKYIMILFAVIFSVGNVSAKETNHRAFEFVYSFTVTEIPDSAKEVKVWAPIPRDEGYQKISDLNVYTTASHSIETEDEYNNKMLCATIFPNGKKELKLSFSFRVDRDEILSAAHALKDADHGDTSAYLKPNKLVIINDDIKKISESVTKGKGKTIEKARAIYDYVFDMMEYDKSGTGWGRGDTQYACDVKKGNCTDFHSLFISLSRAAGIPARFKIGFPLPPDKDSGEVKGYHCWAEFLDKERGWVPVDISEAKKHPEKKEYFFGNVCENRVELSKGRDITLKPKQNGEPLNFFIYPYMEVDGKVHLDFIKDFSFKNI